jgi:hypothetical protein
MGIDGSFHGGKAAGVGTTSRLPYVLSPIKMLAEWYTDTTLEQACISPMHRPNKYNCIL